MNFHKIMLWLLYGLKLKADPNDMEDYPITRNSLLALTRFNVRSGFVILAKVLMVSCAELYSSYMSTLNIEWLQNIFIVQHSYYIDSLHPLVQAVPMYHKPLLLDFVTPLVTWYAFSATKRHRYNIRIRSWNPCVLFVYFALKTIYQYRGIVLWVSK